MSLLGFQYPLTVNAKIPIHKIISATVLGNQLDTIVGKGL